MARRKISQYDARRYKRELEELQRKTRSDRLTWNAIHLVDFTCGEITRARLKTVQDLEHPLACRFDGQELKVYGVR